MAASCENCGCIITRDLEAVVLSADGWYAHRTATCRGCGKTVKWHRAIAGRLGSGYLYLYSQPPRPCSPCCPNYEQLAWVARPNLELEL
jgi:hypothetical protein